MYLTDLVTWQDSLRSTQNPAFSRGLAGSVGFRTDSVTNAERHMFIYSSRVVTSISLDSMTLHGITALVMMPPRFEQAALQMCCACQVRPAIPDSTHNACQMCNEESRMHSKRPTTVGCARYQLYHQTPISMASNLCHCKTDGLQDIDKDC